MPGVSSWFGSGRESSSSSSPSVLSTRDAVKLLHPKTTHFDRHLETGRWSSRFSPLLLEHGEKPLQDWAVVAYSAPSTTIERDIRNKTNNYSNKDGSRSSTTRHGHPNSNDPSETCGTVQWAQCPLKKSSANTNTSSNTHKRKNSSSSAKSNLLLPVDKDSYPSAHMSKMEGRLHLCSGSLVFEPTDPSRGIVRCPFQKMDDAPVMVEQQQQQHPHSSAAAADAVCVDLLARRHMVMKSNNTIGPHESIAIPCRFRFAFLHSSPSAFVDLCQKLFAILSANTSRPSHHHHTSPELDAILKPMLNRPFDFNNLHNVREQVLTGHLRCSILTPLQCRPGTLVLTSDRVYFQEASGVLSTTETRAVSWLQRDAMASARRYHGLRDSALEIYWKDESSTLLALERRHDREHVMRCLTNSATMPCFTDRDFVIDVAQEWQKGTISNYDYLLALNSAAGRSFLDLSRYPVFPWVISDYESSKLDLTSATTFRDLSKPVGALNQQRLEYFQTRLKGMQDMEEAFLYGTHYSAPGYVLYFLVRSMPEHMLCLQNGKFDAPDRMFHSILQCYRCAMTNHADVKELIPEFYNDGHDFDFLINVKGLQLGAMQNGDRVNDVTLPPWARSGRDFIKKNRKALESDYCSRMLPKWFDLIFGCTSRGEGAMEANNVFHHIAYFGPTDLAGLHTEDERFHAELQATEFGIVPDLLFCNEHPMKHAPFDDLFVSPDIGRVSNKEESGRETWELLDVSPHNNGYAQDIQVGIETNLVRHADQNELHPVSRHKEASENMEIESISANAGQSIARNLPLRGTGDGTQNDDSRDERGFSGAITPHDSIRVQQNDSLEMLPAIVEVATSSDWDLKIIERKHIHGDSISGCILYLDENETDSSMLVTTSLDGGLMVHMVAFGTPKAGYNEKAAFSSPFTRFAYSSIISKAGQIAPTMSQPSKLTEYRTHSARDPLASLALASDGAGGSVAFAGGHDDVVLAYGIKSACAVASVYSHRDAVTGLDLISRTPFDSESALWLENSTHIMVSGSWDATVKVWSSSVASGETVSIHREPLAELFDADSSIVCISAKSIPSGGIVIAAGCTDGCFCVWNVHSDGVQVLIHKEPARMGGGACSVVQWISSDGERLHLVAAFSTGRLMSYTLADSSSTNNNNSNVLSRNSAVSLGVAITSLFYVATEDVLLVGCTDGGLRLVPLRNAVHFQEKPTLWSALNNKTSSPSISAIGVAQIRRQQGSKYLCCTGAEDGSITMFELKKI